RTLMQVHPDKRTKLASPSETVAPSSDEHSVDIALIKEAYVTLIDPSSRAAYDASLVREGAYGRGPRPAQVVSLADFTLVTTYERDYDDEKHEWFYECRCGGVYHIVEQDLESGRHLVGCQSCSEVICVGYELVED
ncbi:hypothetical protein EDD15DRAFT_2243557, partial [Pisolithus albus]